LWLQQQQQKPPPPPTKVAYHVNANDHNVARIRSSWPNSLTHQSSSVSNTGSTATTTTTDLIRISSSALNSTAASNSQSSNRVTFTAPQPPIAPSATSTFKAPSPAADHLANIKYRFVSRETISANNASYQLRSADVSEFTGVDESAAVKYSPASLSTTLTKCCSSSSLSQQHKQRCCASKRCVIS
jgi:hypothetical protein